MCRKSLVSIFGILFAVGIWISNSHGKEYPIKPIELLCPYTPGSSTDIMARLVADTAQKYLGQPLVVINKPGAGGSVAAAEVISSNPDGYKLAELTTLFFGTTTKSQKVPFNPYDLVPLASFMKIKTGFTVRGNSPWKTLNDLFDYVRRNPGKLRWGHLGRGSPQHLYGVLILRKAGRVETIDIPFKGTAEQLSGLLGGHIDATVTVFGGLRDQFKTGRIRYLVTFGDHRYSDLPDVPNSTELGIPELAAFSPDVGFYVRKETPGEIKDTLIESFRKTYEDPGFKLGMEKLGEDTRFRDSRFLEEARKKSEIIGVPLLKELGLYKEQK